MKNIFRLSAIATALFTGQIALAQATPVTKPADATGQCKDGSYSTAASKAGACRGHKGVKEWYAATAPTAAATAATAAPAPASKPVTPSVPQTPSPTTQARTQTQSAAQSASQAPMPPATTSIAKSTPGPAAIAPAAAGGGPGMVWLNASTKVYHCPGTRFYGKTKSGSYMSEADAKAAGAHADHGTACTK